MAEIDRRMTLQAHAARLLNSASAILAGGVVTDSTAEHYRAGFHNPVMFVAPAVSSVAFATAARASAKPAGGGRMRGVVYAASIVTGLVGLALHLRNVSRRPGGWTSTSVFYGAPLAAPLAMAMAGTLGLVSSRVAAGHVGRSDARALGCVASLGLVGTSLEAAVLHFRGAFQNPFMYAPVMLPPAAAIGLAAASLGARPALLRTAGVLLRATGVLGIGGTVLHAWGVQRRMGGWRNWSQNLLAGPPLPAPPAFTGLALAGLAALELRTVPAERE